MNRLMPSQDYMRKYRQLGFERHHILEAWTGCQENEAVFLKTLLQIRSRDQLCSEQRLVWDGKRAPIKRIVNQTKLKKFLARTFLKGYNFYPHQEFKELRKKGLLLRKEYRGHCGLDLEPNYSGFRLRNEDIRRLAKKIEGYLRRLKHLSIKLYFSSVWSSNINITPLLKSIQHNFAGLVSLKLSLRDSFELGWKCLGSFERLFGRLRPTLKHLDLDFIRNRNLGINFPQILGWIIMRNLHQLETLYLNFGDTRFPLSVVMFFINTACSHLPHLRKLNLQMTNCFVDNQWYLPQTSLRNNLRSLVLNLDFCLNLDIEYLLLLQNDITQACPELEELYIRLPNYKRFSGRFLCAIEEKFLQKLNLKKIGIVLSNELEETWNNYEDVQAIERAEEMRVIDSACKIRQKAKGEEEFRLYYETLIESEKLPDGHFLEFDEQDHLLNQLQGEQTEKEQNEIDEQDGAEDLLQGGLTYEEFSLVNAMGLFGFYGVHGVDNDFGWFDEEEEEVLVTGLGVGYEEDDGYEEEINVE